MFRVISRINKTHTVTPKPYLLTTVLMKRFENPRVSNQSQSGYNETMDHTISNKISPDPVKNRVLFIAFSFNCAIRGQTNMSTCKKEADSVLINGLTIMPLLV
jgi:hypothetical protein